MAEFQYDWYQIFNLDDFNDMGLVSKTYTYILQSLGEKDFLVTKGNLVGITYEGVYLPISMNDINPFEFEDFAIYKNADNDVFWGIKQAGQ